MTAALSMLAGNDIRLTDLISHSNTHLDDVFLHYIDNIPSSYLKASIEYSFVNGGKRLRPLLIFAAGYIFDAAPVDLAVPACAVELIHTYSLIHDDLPCMDNAALRRGMPTCHLKFGEGMAVLTGDALHTLAMQIIANHPCGLRDETRLRMIGTLSQACGPYGMAGGQAMDLTLMHDRHISSQLLEKIYNLKTGALLNACTELAHLAAGDQSISTLESLQSFSSALGLAFQIQDDLLDIESNDKITGKPQALDSQNNKITFPEIYGISASKARVTELYQQALDSLANFNERANLLRELANLIINRTH